VSLQASEVLELKKRAKSKNLVREKYAQRIAIEQVRTLPTLDVGRARENGS